MEPKYPIVVTPGAIRDVALAALRILSVLIGGFTAIVGLVGKRDLAGLIAYVQSEDFLAVAGAVVAVVSFAWGLYSTHKRKAALLTVEPLLPDTVIRKTDASPVPPSAFNFLFLGLVGLTMLAGCNTLGNVRLETNKAFYTAQVALRAAQQTTLATCTQPPVRLVEPCQKAINLLHEGAKAEAAGFTAQQAENAADLQTAVLILMAVPPQLAALGVLEAR